MTIPKTNSENQYSDCYKKLQAIGPLITNAIRQVQQSDNEKEAYQYFMGKHHLIELMKLFRNSNAH